MSNLTPTSIQAKRALRRPPFFAFMVLRAVLLLVVAFFPNATPRLGMLNLTEAEAPLDQDESSEEAAISLQARTRVRRNQPGTPWQIPVAVGLNHATASTTPAPHAGHRLPNHLLAPLRC